MSKAIPTLSWLPSTLSLVSDDVVPPDAAAGLSPVSQPVALLSPDELFEDPESFAQPTTDSTLVSAIAATATPRLKRKAFSLRVHHTLGATPNANLLARPYSAVA
jgi:hypothetical protein